MFNWASIDRRRSVLALGALCALSACQPSQAPSFASLDITGASYAQDFALPDADGRVRTLADFRGKVVVVFFGFTQCPDVCPTTLQELALIKQELGPDGARVVPVFITVDPDRDTPALLKAYVSNFSPDAVALRGNAEQLQATARAFRVVYNKVPNRSGEGYTLDHTAASFVFDPKGRLRLYARYGQGPQPLLADIRQLLRGA
ncbi:MAG: SCO family protein [Inhella sp.]|uniref:SCO family protein n=1 Tax=Inhella sp. TaxID=1921806 RepID=UPI003918F9E4